MELLRDYTRRGSEAAFAELVRRHIDLVYSVALRQVGSGGQAEEITQAVFVILAQKGGRLRPDTVLEAWLYQTARLTAWGFMRGERRRRRREQEAYMESDLQESGEPPIWNQLGPLLDEAMARLGRVDREAVVLRYFKGKSLAEVAAAINITEAAAQSRVHRAVGKLQKYFLRRGINSTTAAVAGAIAANSIQVAPLAFVKTTTAVALAQGATASVSTLSLIQGALKMMAWAKLKIAVVAGGVILLTTGAAILAVNEMAAPVAETDRIVALIEPGSNIGSIRAGMSPDQLWRAIGRPEATVSNRQILKYSRFGLTIHNGIHGVDWVECGDFSGTNLALAKACRIRTEENIAMGASRAEIIRAYNMPDTNVRLADGREQLGYRWCGLAFTLKGGKVIHIMVDFPVVASSGHASIFYLRDDTFFKNLERAVHRGQGESDTHALLRYFWSLGFTLPPQVQFDELAAAGQGLKGIVRIRGLPEQAVPITTAMGTLLAVPPEH